MSLVGKLIVTMVCSRRPGGREVCLELILGVTPLNAGNLMCKRAHMELNQGGGEEGRRGGGCSFVRTTYSYPQRNYTI